MEKEPGYQSVYTDIHLKTQYIDNFTTGKLTFLKEYSGSIPNDKIKIGTKFGNISTNSDWILEPSFAYISSEPFAKRFASLIRKTSQNSVLWFSQKIPEVVAIQGEYLLAPFSLILRQLMTLVVNVSTHKLCRLQTTDMKPFREQL